MFLHQGQVWKGIINLESLVLIQIMGDLPQLLLYKTFWCECLGKWFSHAIWKAWAGSGRLNFLTWLDLLPELFSAGGILSSVKMQYFFIVMFCDEYLKSQHLWPWSLCLGCCVCGGVWTNWIIAWWLCRSHYLSSSKFWTFSYQWGLLPEPACWQDCLEYKKPLLNWRMTTSNWALVIGVTQVRSKFIF